MELVADTLTTRALAAANLSEANLFGRSAFNRYYYGVYLAVREMLRVGHPEIYQVKHKELPDQLVGKVRSRIVDEAKRQVKKKVLSDSEAERLIHKSTVALQDLAEILRDGFRIRVIADYDPEVEATVENGHIVLDDRTSDAARNWGVRASRSIGQVQKVWRQLGIGD